MRIVFRADASREMGSGHIMRCLTLADSLAAMGARCSFAVSPGSQETVPALAEAGYDLIKLEVAAADEAEELRQHRPHGVDWLVVDHYGRDRTFEAACRPWARGIMVLDDLADRSHDCDLLLDQTLGRTTGDYGGLLPPACRKLMGTRYALLRPEFRKLRQGRSRPAASSRSPLRLLVTLGGTDPDNLTGVCIDAIGRSGIRANVDVVASQGFSSLPELRRRIESLAGHTLHVSPASMGNLMASADLAIGAAGTTSWERCCLGLPTVMLVLADNQRENAKQLSAVGAAAVVDDQDGGLAEAISAQLRQLDRDRAALQDMSLKASAVCDGQGALRARLSFLPRQTTKDGSGVLLRLAEAEDEATLLRWQQQPSIRALARNPKIPTEAEHRVWFAARMTSETSFITMIEHGDEVAGMLRLDRLEPADKHEVLEVSIVVDDGHRGLGVGLAALKQIRAWMPEVEFRAETLPNNHPSIALFRAAGYRALEGNLLHSTAA